MAGDGKERYGVREAMIRGILFDNGGVLQAPLSGNWILCPRYRDFLGGELDAVATEKLSQFCSTRMMPLPEEQLIDGEQEELRLYEAFYKAAFSYAGLALSDETIRGMSEDMVYNDRRVYVFEDVPLWLGRWKGQYEMGLLSDATPSSKRIVHRTGISAYMDSETYSFELGVAKPSEKMFQAALSKFHTPAEEILFIDDSPVNLAGAARLGLQTVQMRRGAAVPATDPWDGAYVGSLAELDAYLTKCGR